MSGLAVPAFDYTQYSNRQLVTIPLALLAISILVIAGTWVATGAPAHLGMDFTGGVEAQIQTDATTEEIAAAFSTEPESIQPVRAQEDVYIVTFRADDAVGTGGNVTDETPTNATPTNGSQPNETSTNESQLNATGSNGNSATGGQADVIEREAEAAGFSVQSIQETSASFGAETQVQALVAVAVAFVGMSILVALFFRSFVPSIAIVASAFSDVVIPIALMNLFGIELSLGTVAALLMLIGYSVDSDILLNNHILRRRGDFYESTRRAMRTGVTMTLTSIVAMAVMTVVASLFQIPLLPAVGIVLVFGLAADLMNTYLLNVSLLRWYKYEGVAR